MGNKDATHTKPQMLYPMLLGGVSAFAVLVLASFILAMYKDKCCARRPTRKSTHSRLSDIRAKAEAKIAYDIPMKSKAIISSCWQQEDNDIADEVKRLYRDISTSSRPVLFGSGTGVFLQEAKDRDVIGFPVSEMRGKANGITQLDSIKHDNNVVNCKGHSIFGEVVSEKQDSKSIEQENFNQKISENTLTKVQDWVNNSFRQIELTQNEVGDNKKETESQIGKNRRLFEKHEKMENLVSGKSQIGLPGKANSRQTVIEQKNSEEEYLTGQPTFLVAENAVGESTHSESKNLASSNSINNYEYARDNKVTMQNSKENTGYVNEDTQKGMGNIPNTLVKVSNFTKMDPPRTEPVKLSYMTDFQHSDNMKNLMLTRWVDHASQQQPQPHNTPDLVEDWSAIARNEDSFNDLQYEDIESILTSVSRMDEKRIQKLKGTKFYKELLIKKVKMRTTNNTKLCSTTENHSGRRRDEKTVPHRDGSSVINKNIGDRGHPAAAATYCPVKLMRDQDSKLLSCSESVACHTKHASSHLEAQNQAHMAAEDRRSSLSESEIHDDSTEGSESYTLNESQQHEDTPRYSNKQTSLFGSERLHNRREVLLKYSLVRNFSNRFKPLVYVSLTHIQGLDCVIKSGSLFSVKMYLTHDKQSIQHSGPLACSNDIYIEEMFEVAGSSTKNILNDSLTIEVIRGDENEAFACISLDLKGLRHKATLLSTVQMKKIL